MRGHIKKRATWQFTVDLGPQSLQRCPVCKKRYWTKDRGRLGRCPKCAGPLEDRLERRQDFHSGYKTKREAEEELAKVIGALATGTFIHPSKLTVDEYLQREWLPAIRATIRPTTFLSYSGHVEHHLIPALGRIPLQQLSAGHINAFYAQLLSEDRPGKGCKLAPATVRRIHATLHRALKDAVRWNKISRNPSDAADPPRAATCAEAQINVWSIPQLRNFLIAERGSHFYPLWLTLITTGLRRGEALGLRWQDVDLQAHTLAIRQTRVLYGYQPLLSTPKTRKGKRLVALDPATAACLEGLHEQRQAGSGADANAGESADLVFLDEHGQPIHPERATTLFGKAAKAARVPRIRLHDLRHTHATLALSAGVHPKIVSERLGHANIGITLDTYSHCLPALSEEAACRVAALVVPA
jgi:integrase